MSASVAGNGAARPAFDPALLRRMLALTRPYRGIFGLSIFLYVPLNAGALLQPFLLGAVVDSVVHAGPSQSADAIRNLGLAYLGALLLQTVGQFVQLSLTQWLGQRVTRDVRKVLFAKLQRLDPAWFDRTPMGQVMARLTGDVESLAEVFASDSATLLGDLLFLVATAALLLWKSPTLTLASFAVLPVLAFGLRRFRDAAREAFREVRGHASSLSTFMQEHLAGMSVVQLFGQEARTAEAFDQINLANTMANRRAVRLDAGIYAFVEAVSTVSVAILLVAAAHETSQDALTLGAAVAFVEYLQRFFIPVKDLSTKYTILQSAMAGGERIFALLDEPEALRNADGATAICGIGEGIRFDDVAFSYRSGTHAVRGVSFVVKAGQKVALVGRTGSGKTTLTRLLLRHYQPQVGHISVAGHDVTSLNQESLQRTIVTVPQEVHLFSGTLAENLRFGAPEATDGQLWAALEAVQARELVERLPGGLGAVVKERGQNLSVGERQLVAFARALLANPPCIILDEATASVDPETERRLQTATARLLEGRTALIVAHRLSTLSGCDNIIVLQAGQVLEQGTHEQLLQRNGHYARLHALQDGLA